MKKYHDSEMDELLFRICISVILFWGIAITWALIGSI